jgi:hypothetical protein
MPGHTGILGSFVVGLVRLAASITIHGVASMSVSLRPRRGLPSSTAQPCAQDGDADWRVEPAGTGLRSAGKVRQHPG